MSPGQRNRRAAALKAAGYEDAAPLTVQSTDGEIPQGRELSLAWLSGTVLTGLTSVLLMGAALYVSFDGRDTFSTAYRALHIASPSPAATADLSAKTVRARPVAQTRSDREVVEASIRETVDGRDMIRRQPFIRVRATLATAATSLSEDIPEYDPVALLSSSQPIEAENGAESNVAIYGAEVEGEVAVQLAALPMGFAPPRAISDQAAAEYVRLAVEGFYTEAETATLAYASVGAVGSIRDLGIVTGGSGLAGVAENVTVLPKTTLPEEAGLGRTERILTVREASRLEDVLRRNGFTDTQIGLIAGTIRNVYPSTQLPQGARLRILLGPSSTADTLVPQRLSIYTPDAPTATLRHAATVALTDRGQYVLGLAPPDIEFPEEDTEEINVANLPTVYRSIWETGRKHDLDDATIERIVAMFAYDVDLTKRVAAGDTIEVLETAPDGAGHRDLLYVRISLGTTTRELFRFQTGDGTIDFYDPDGETGKRFLVRRPLEGGGTLRSRFGYRIHPIFKTRRLHTGLDLAAPTGTPIYAAGDGTVEMAQWYSGYGRYVEINHANGFATAYGHMNAIASGISPGTQVRQGQLIGYVGSTGQSTGPHLHFEIKVNGRFVDPLSVRLPRENTLPVQYEREFAQSVAQIRDLMERPPAPVAVAAAFLSPQR